MYVEGGVVFPEMDFNPRTDSLFEQMSDEDHYTSRSPLLGLGISMDLGYPLDYSTVHAFSLFTHSPHIY